MSDNECFKWCIVKNLHSPDHHPARIKTIDEILPYELDFAGKKISSQNQRHSQNCTKEFYQH